MTQRQESAIHLTLVLPKYTRSKMKTFHQKVQEFLESNKSVMGNIDVVITADGENIDLKNMTEEQAEKAANALFMIGTPSRSGSMAKQK